MTTTLYEVKFSDGRVFRVFCQGKNQEKRLLKKLSSISWTGNITVMVCGIHTIAEFEMLNK
jgi:hypothetical protein